METVLGQDEIVDELNKVLQIDIDAVGAYQTAVDAIDAFEVQRQLLQFKADHERHVSDLQAMIRRFGGKPAQRRDLRGMLQRGFTRVAGLVGTEATLRAMLQNEKVTNSAYARCAGLALPPDVLDLVRRNWGDEQRHYAWIETALRQRLWEKPTVPTVP